MKKIIFVFIFLHFSFITTNAQWIRLQSGTNITLSGVSFTNQNTGITVGYRGIILKTTNSGVNWIQQTYGDTLKLNSICMLNSNTCIAAGWMGIIIRTTNSGTEWVKITSPANMELRDIHFMNENTGYIVGDIVLKTTNSGYNWQIVNNIPPLASELYDIAFFNISTGFIVGWPYTIGFSTIVRTTNGGDNWILLGGVPGLDANLYGVSFIDINTVIAVGSGLIFKSTNCGITWTYQYTEGYTINKVAFTNLNTGFAVGSNRRIIKTTNAGINWTVQSSGMSNYHLWSLSIIDSMNGFTVGDSGTILKTTNGGISYIESKKGEILKNFNLYQNYPNPFNTNTIINYKLRIKNYVSLKVFDIKGNLISILYKGKQNPGEYKIVYDGSNLSTGVYFYQLSSENYKQTKKFIILK